MEDRYAKRGVSTQKEDVHQAIKNLDKGLFPKAFCKVVPDYFSGDPDSALVMHADGAGTKSALAYAYWRSTGDLSVFKGLAQDALVMNTDDLLCVGLHKHPVLYASSIARNKHRIPGEVISTIIEGTEDLLQNFREWGLPIHSTGGETADVGDLVQTLLVDATVICRLPRKSVIENSQIKPGNVIVGFASFGQASYEKTYNSGIGSNGLTSARHDLLSKNVANRFPETFDHQSDPHFIYSGKFDLTDTLPHLPLNIGQMILSPTRTYLPMMQVINENYMGKIFGMVHCTGGGQTKVLHFIENLHIVKNNLLPMPPIFELIHQTTPSSFREMYQVFNMGHRLEIYTDEASAQGMIQIAKSFNIDAQIIGYCEAHIGKKLSIYSPEGVICY